LRPVETRRHGERKFIRPAVTTIIVERRLRKAYGGFFVKKIDARRATAWKFIAAGKGNAIFSGSKVF